MKYFKNTSWIMIEKIFGMGMRFLIIIFIARYLGPEQFGIFSYALALVTLFGMFGHMGLSGLVIKEIVNNPKNTNKIIGTTFWLKLLGLIIGIILLYIYTYFFENDNLLIILIYIMSIALIFQSFEVISFWFLSSVKAKYISISKISAIVLTSIYNVILIILSANIIYFACANIIQGLIFSVLLIYFYRKIDKLKIYDWKFSFKLTKDLLSRSWMIFFAAVLTMIYFKIDQIMLKWLSDMNEVGTYSAASTLSEAVYFIAASIVASIYPKLLELKKINTEEYYDKLQKLLNLLFIIAISISILLSISSEFIISVLFGDEYKNSVSIFVIHIWASIFIYLRMVFDRWFIMEDIYKIYLLTQLIGAVTNIVLNYILIPYFQGVGAAIATLISYGLASYLSLYFYKETKIMFFMMSKAFIFPIYQIKKKVW